MQTIKPATNQLFCKPDEAEQQLSKSGLYIQKSAVDKPQTAQVVNVGSGVTGFKQKDKVIYKPYSTTDIKLEDVQYFLIAEEDVLGTVVESSE